MLEWDALPLPGGTHPAYLIPESIRRRLVRAKAWRSQSVCVGGTAEIQPAKIAQLAIDSGV
uniref:Uncharacterized protein n=1 Tax=Callorhinchus milii TaxID=7868 RepID=A0A4W3H1J0_CALMI